VSKKKCDRDRQAVLHNNNKKIHFPFPLAKQNSMKGGAFPLLNKDGGQVEVIPFSAETRISGGMTPVARPSLHPDDPTAPCVFRVLTLNCWGVPIASYKEPRMAMIGRRLAESNYDIVCLQEVWFDRDWQIIRTALRDNAHTQLRHAHRFRSGAIGSGIVILSRFPIIEASFQCYNSSGKFYKFWHGDAYAGKGIAHAILQTPIGNLDIFSTHTHASYDETRIIHEEYHGVRLAQLLQLAKYVKNTARHGLAMVMGDFNATPDSTEMRMFQEISGFSDSFNAYQESKPAGEKDAGYTCTLDNVFNTSGCLTSMIFPSPDTIFPTRLDYIFHQFVASGKYKRARVSRAAVTFEGNDVKVPGKALPVPYSDHYGVEATFELLTTEAPESEAKELDQEPQTPRDHVALMVRSIEVLDHSIKEADLRRRIFMVSKWVLLIVTVILEVLLFTFVSDTYLQRSLVIISALVFGTLIILFFFLDKSMVPAEISSLEQSRGEIGLLWRVWSYGRLSITLDDAVHINIEGSPK
jgi:sphingomyelin phosphodiesterase 2